MKSERLLTIGELAKICDVSLKTLRYYDETGLLAPAHINPENNYRFYSTWQINRILTIKELKKIGFTLETIKSCMSCDGQDFDLYKLEELLDTKENEINSQINELIGKIQKIQIYKKYHLFIYKNIQLAEKGIHTVYMPARKFIYKHYEGKYDHEVFRHYFKLVSDKAYEYDPEWYGIPSARFYERFNFNSIKTDIGYVIENGIPFIEGVMEDIESGTYAVSIYRGDYMSMLKEGYNKLFEWIDGKGFYVNGPSIECYYIGENVSTQGSQYVTEIQMPVKKI